MLSLSIVVPIYKVERYLDQCVQSILGQTFSDFELILVDDGSPDTCPQLCDEWAAKDPRIKVIHKPNGGLRSAIIAGQKIATGVYTGYVDGDDWIAGDYFDKLVSAAVNSGADMVAAGWTVHNGVHALLEQRQQDSILASRKTVEGKVLQIFWEAGEELPFGNSRWSKLWKTDLLNQIMDDLEDQTCMGEDLEQALRYLPLCSKVVTISDCCGYYYRKNQESITQAFSEKTITQFENLKNVLRRIADQQGRAYAAREKREAIYNFTCLYQMQASRQHFLDYIRYTKTILSNGPILVHDNISIIFRGGFILLEQKRYYLGCIYLRILFIICAVIRK